MRQLSWLSFATQACDLSWIPSIHMESQVGWGSLVIPAQEDPWDSPACQPSWVNPRSLKETLSPKTKWTESQGIQGWPLASICTHILHEHAHIHTYTCMNIYINLLTYIHLHIENVWTYSHTHTYIPKHTHTQNPLFEGTWCIPSTERRSVVTVPEDGPKARVWCHDALAGI